MSRKRITRRRFLRGMVGGAVATLGLPLLEVHMGTHGVALADGSPFPKRFGLFFWGNGVVPQAWVPETTGPDYELSYLMEPLAPIKDRMTVVTGTGLRVDNIEPHWSGMSGVLTGQPVIIKPSGGWTMPDRTVDQVIAEAIGGETRFRSIEQGVRPGDIGVSYNGPDNPNPTESSPFALYDRIFGADFREPGSDAEPDPRLALRRSVLDSVMTDITDFERDLGSADRARLDQHLTSVRELELRLQRLAENPANLDACIRPDRPESDFPDIDGRPQLQALNRAMCDILALTLACDQTRVFTHAVTRPLNNLLLAEATAGHHQLTHDEPGDQPMVQSIVRQIMGEYTYLVETLDSIPEGDGTLLDHCVVLGTSDISYGRTHGLDEFPIIYSGTGNGRLVTGTHIRSEIGENTNELMLSLMRAVDVLAPSWGTDAAYAEDGFSPIEV